MLQAGLFESPAHELEAAVSDGSLPRGLAFLPDFISAAEERDLVASLDDPSRSTWSHELSRRVQHFGYRYNYKLRALSAADKIAEAPEAIRALGHRLVDLGYFASAPDQVIVNEYEPGQGISPHVDRETCFGSAVASLSLTSDVVMEFRSPANEYGAILLPARSLIVLRDEARYSWKHSISARKRDTIQHCEFPRSRRLSLTFRTVLVADEDVGR